MDRRGFLHTLSQLAAAVGLTRAAQSAERHLAGSCRRDDSQATLRDLGWVWEGQGIDPQVPPSIYGLGQGARYFGLSRAHFLFHPNDVHALRLLADYDEVVCDISKWGWEWNADGRPACVARGDLATVQTEGENVGRLARQFPNVTGVYCDDLLGLMKRFHFGPPEFGDMRAAIRSVNDALKLWTVVYTHEFDQVDFWTRMRPHIDVVTLWIWDSDSLDNMPAYVDQCCELFPDKPIVMGVYLRDYGKVAPIPVDRVIRQMKDIARLIRSGKLAGYTILAAVLIDGHRTQADAVRDFIASESRTAIRG